MAGCVRLPVLRPLVDGAKRPVTYLRISVTDRCNFECAYCAPSAAAMSFAPASQLLSFEEIARVVRVFTDLGVRRVRLTGGEPTVRRDIVKLVAILTEMRELDELVMTSNALRLAELARPLADAGLAGVNISLDTLDPALFASLTRRGRLDRVVAGIDAAVEAGLEVKLNAVVLRGVNEGQLGDLCQFAWERGLVIRFIEHMPLSGGVLFEPGRFVGAAEIRARLGEQLGIDLYPAPSSSAVRGPARYWQAGAADQRVGLISAITENFCGSCNRLRLTATGQLYSCLGDGPSTDLRAAVRAGEEEVRRRIAAAVGAKRAGHAFERSGAGAPTQHMLSMGG